MLGGRLNLSQKRRGASALAPGLPHSLPACGVCVCVCVCVCMYTCMCVCTYACIRTSLSQQPKASISSRRSRRHTAPNTRCCARRSPSRRDAFSRVINRRSSHQPPQADHAAAKELRAHRDSRRAPSTRSPCRRSLQRCHAAMRARAARTRRRRRACSSHRPRSVRAPPASPVLRVCVHIHVYVHQYICKYAYIYIYTHTHTHTRIYTHVYVYMHAYWCVRGHAAAVESAGGGCQLLRLPAVSGLRLRVRVSGAGRRGSGGDSVTSAAVRRQAA